MNGPDSGTSHKPVLPVLSSSRRSTVENHNDEGYVFAVQRHGDLVRRLGISDWAAGTADGSFEVGEEPGGLSEDAVLRTTNPERRAGVPVLPAHASCAAIVVPLAAGCCVWFQ